VFSCECTFHHLGSSNTYADTIIKATSSHAPIDRLNMSRAHAQVTVRPGRYIYAYVHRRTQQVVYSLTQTLRNSRALRHLPDLGANNKDAVLRKDLWQPFFTVCLPDGEDGQKQGLDVFKKLREWRKLHELYWQPTELMRRTFGPADIERLQERLDERGGSKKESPYDVIKRIKKKERVRIVQDQKANSVADLAAVLLEQEKVGVRREEEQKHQKKLMRKIEARELENLAAMKDQGRLEQLEASLTDLKARLVKLDRDGKGSEPLSRRKLLRSIRVFTARKEEIDFAVRALENSRRTASKARAEGDEVRPGLETLENGPTDTLPVTKAQLRAALPSIPPEMIARMPRRSPLRPIMKQLQRPIFHIEGITIKWNNMLDAEFAEAWPSKVNHESMGWVRHTAPSETAVAVSDGGDLSVAEEGDKALEGADKAIYRTVKRELLDRVKTEFRLRDDVPPLAVITYPVPPPASQLKKQRPAKVESMD